MIRELPRKAISGLSILVLLLPVSIFAILGIISAARADAPGRAIGFLVLFMLVIFLLVGLFTVQPERGPRAAALRQLQGHRAQGRRLWWANPVL